MSYFSYVAHVLVVQRKSLKQIPGEQKSSSEILFRFGSRAFTEWMFMLEVWKDILQRARDYAPYIMMRPKLNCPISFSRNSR